jgi:hypothetical protein
LSIAVETDEVFLPGFVEARGQSLPRDLWGDLLPKGNHPNSPGQPHVKFGDGDEHKIPFLATAKNERLFQEMNHHHFLREDTETEITGNKI